MTSVNLFGSMDCSDDDTIEHIVSPSKRRTICSATSLRQQRRNSHTMIKHNTHSLLAGMQVQSHSATTSPIVQSISPIQQPPLFALSNSTNTTVNHSATHSPFNYRRLSVSSTDNNTTQSSPRIRATPLHPHKLHINTTNGTVRNLHRHGSTIRSSISRRNDIYKTAPASELAHMVRMNAALHTMETENDIMQEQHTHSSTPPRALKTMSIHSACTTPLYTHSPFSSPTKPPLSRPGSGMLLSHIRNSPLPDIDVFMTKLSAPSPARKRTLPPTPTPRKKRNSNHDFSFNIETDGILYSNDIFVNDNDTSVIKLDDFTYDSRIGVGSYAEVWQCSPNNTDIIHRQYAVKKCIHEFDSNAEREAAIKHIELLKRITQPSQHNNILQHYCIWQQHGKLNTCTELCMSDCSELNPINLADRNLVADSHDLNDSNSMHDISIHHTTSMTEDEMWRFIQHTAAGLQHLHSNNIIHCDIKPENIFRTSDNAYKLGDLASMTDCNDLHNVIDRADGKCLAPEAFNKSIPFGTHSDIFALGITCYIIITGGTVPERLDTTTIELDFSKCTIQCSHTLVNAIRSMCCIDIYERPTASQLVHTATKQLNNVMSILTPNRPVTIQDPSRFDQKYDTSGSGSSQHGGSAIDMDTCDIVPIRSARASPISSPRGTTKRAILF